MPIDVFNRSHRKEQTLLVSKEWREDGVCIRTKTKNCLNSPYSSTYISYAANDTYHPEFANPFRSESPVSLFLVCRFILGSHLSSANGISNNCSKYS